jgi:dihydrolipoamide dehydrogenase
MSSTPDNSAFDVIVVGGGPGGYVAAIRASQLGLKTACVERAELGGVCLNWGCIPTKALLHSAKLRQEMAHGDEHGFTIGPVTVAWNKLIERSRGVAKRLNRGVAGLFKKYGVTHVAGEARLDRPGRVLVRAADGSESALTAAHVIVATGARPRPFPGLPFDGERVWNSSHAMTSREAPKRLIVLGGGAIGCEFAYFYNAFGSAVTLVEMGPRLLGPEDDEISAALAKSFAKQGIDVKTGTRVTNVAVSDSGVRVTAASEAGETVIEGDVLLVAIGVVGNVEGLGLEGCGVELNRGWVVVDRDLRTTCPGIYAIGDVAGPPWLAHKASAEGIHCVERIAGHAGHPVRADNIPGCTYCEPQVASVGLTERACVEQGLPTRIGRFPLTASGKALALGEKEGLVKVIHHAETGELLGLHMIGAQVTELVAVGGLARSAELTEEDLLGTVFAHPTLSEAIHEAIGLAHGHAVNF